MCVNVIDKGPEGPGSLALRRGGVTPAERIAKRTANIPTDALGVTWNFFKRISESGKASDSLELDGDNAMQLGRSSSLLVISLNPTVSGCIQMSGYRMFSMIHSKSFDRDDGEQQAW